MGEDGGDHLSNSTRYAERAETAGMLRATQEELASKIKELQLYEGNYTTLKRDLSRWKKKFEYVFRENELLALETGKLDASHKQIAFLQQELKFKEEEGSALRGLVSALEAASKKQRAKQLEAARARDSELEAVAALAAERKSNEDADAALVAANHEKERLGQEIAALKAENALLLKDVDRKDEELQRQEEQVGAHKGRILGLEEALKGEQEAGMQRLKDKQDKVLELERQVQQMQMRRRSSVAAALAQAEEEGRDTVGFGPTDRLKASHISEGDETVHSDEEPDTPPGTPPPISSGGLLPPEDPTADQTIRDWTEDRKLRAARSFDEALDLDKLEELIRKLPYEHQDGASRVLMGALDPDSTADAVDESQIVLRHLSSERQADLRDFLLPLLKAHPALRVSYATMERRTLVTDVRITIERRRNSVLGGFVPGENRFGKDHMFLGPSVEDVGKLVPHQPRVISTSNKATYMSKPKHVEPVDNAPTSSPLERGSEHTEDMDTASESADVPDVTASNRKWRGLTAAKFIGTMAAGAKQRVAATFKNTKFTHEGTSCQFCKMTPIVGERYSCGTCVGFDLCENCYSLGGHGLENSDELFYRVQELVLARCPRLVEEVDLLELMRFEICRSNLRKFSFCLNWLADIVNGKSSRDLQARALEIPSIRRDVRKVFVPLLMRVCSDREDIEVKTEWELEDDNQAAVRTVAGNTAAEGDGRFLETLRIWVADQYRTTSPFVERSLLKYREGEEGEEGEGEEGSDNDNDAQSDGGHSHENGGHSHDEPDEPDEDPYDDVDDDPYGGGIEGSSSQPGFVERNRIHSDQF
ncbi:E3 ubiquitin-protein ligase HERC2 [Phytophthora ramorum]|uniref:E3 ubiquitin-protein ligase HERC2 n=1 Tax=Phytophthora ramorum TaxID=164328 RepID=UPI00309C985A|nr:E3 ubiquitin-protein ligase HERC2 [Phytophthora ramorum]